MKKIVTTQDIDDIIDNNSDLQRLLKQNGQRLQQIDQCFEKYIQNRQKFLNGDETNKELIEKLESVLDLNNLGDQKHVYPKLLQKYIEYIRKDMQKDEKPNDKTIMVYTKYCDTVLNPFIQQWFIQVLPVLEQIKSNCDFILGFEDEEQCDKYFVFNKEKGFTYLYFSKTNKKLYDPSEFVYHYYQSINEMKFLTRNWLRTEKDFGVEIIKRLIYEESQCFLKSRSKQNCLSEESISKYIVLDVQLQQQPMLLKLIGKLVEKDVLTQEEFIDILQ